MRTAMSNAPAAPSPTPALDEAHRLRLAGDLWSARRLAGRLAAAGGPEAEGARALLALTGTPRAVYAFAALAFAIQVALLTLAALRS